MNATTMPPPPPPSSPPPGPDGQRMRSIVETRRATQDRMIAGVATGIGRQLGIDPIIVRIVFIAFCFAGFSGGIAYLTAWFVLPSDDGRRSVMADWFNLKQSEPQARTVGLLLGGAIAVLSIVGGGGFFWGAASLALILWILWIPVAAVLLYWVLVVTPRKRAERQSHAPGFPTARPMPPTADTTERDVFASAPAADQSADVETGESSDQVSPDSENVETAFGGTPLPPETPPAMSMPAWQPPPPREPPILFLATISAIAIALGVLWFTDRGLDLDLDPAAYPALALTVTGAGLLVGSRWGRSIALVPVGVFLTICLAATAAIPDGPVGDFVRTPDSAAEVRSLYDLGAGSLEIDLTEVDNPEELLGRTITIDGGLGEIIVIVPEDLPVSVETWIQGGEITVFEHNTAGWNTDLDVASDAHPSLRFDITHTFGEITVERS